MGDLMERFFGNDEEWALTRFTPPLNLSETENGYEVTVELPGMEREHVSVELREGDLCISGEKHEEKEEKDKAFHRIERRHGEFRRLVHLPGAVAEEKVEAKFVNGILTVIVPKSEEAKPKRIPVKE
jgi:HSP20 family protein